MEVIKGGTFNGIEFSCMYDSHNIIAEYSKEKEGKQLMGLSGIAVSLDNAPSILWFDETMNFIEGSLLQKCVNCTYVGKSGGGFFAECLLCGFQVNDPYAYSCEEIILKTTK